MQSIANQGISNKPCYVDRGVQGDPLGFLHHNKLGGFLLLGCDLLILADQGNR